MIINVIGKDLTAREFKAHRKCYRDYTHTKSENETWKIKFTIKVIMKKNVVLHRNK